MGKRKLVEPLDKHMGKKRKFDSLYHIIFKRKFYVGYRPRHERQYQKIEKKPQDLRVRKGFLDR